jgi:hypothetical protein
LYRKRGALRIKSPPPRPPHHPNPAGAGAAAEQPIASVGLESADRDPGRHREPGLDRAGVRIDAADLAVVAFPHAVPQLAVDPGHAGDVAVGLQRPQDRAGRGIDLVDLAIAVLADPQRAFGPRQPESRPAPGAGMLDSTAPVAGSILWIRPPAIWYRWRPS